MSDAPDWAAFLGDGYPALRQIVVEELARREMAFDPEHLDCGVVYTPSAGTFGLANVARLCHAAPRQDWPAIVGDHFRRCLARAVDLDLELALPRLRVRVVPERHLGDKLVTRPLADGLALALAIDKPEHVVFVSPTDLARWDRVADDLFEVAHAHTRAEPPLERMDFPLDGGGAVSWLHGPSYYATSHVLFLDRYLAPGRHGHVVGLPDRHAVVAFPLDGAASLRGLGPTVSVCHGRFGEEPGALTDQLYWRRIDGSLVKIPCGVGDGGAPWVAPPDAFNDAVLS